MQTVRQMEALLKQLDKEAKSLRTHQLVLKQAALNALIDCGISRNQAISLAVDSWIGCERSIVKRGDLFDLARDAIEGVK